LCRCDGAEEQQRLVTADPAVLAWLASRANVTIGTTRAPKQEGMAP
jgi:hypothetical protein